MSIRADKEFTMVAGQTVDTSAEYSGMVFCFISPKGFGAKLSARLSKNEAGNKQDISTDGVYDATGVKACNIPGNIFSERGWDKITLAAGSDPVTVWAKNANA